MLKLRNPKTNFLTGLLQQNTVSNPLPSPKLHNGPKLLNALKFFKAKKVFNPSVEAHQRPKSVVAPCQLFHRPTPPHKVHSFPTLQPLYVPSTSTLTTRVKKNRKKSSMCSCTRFYISFLPFILSIFYINIIKGIAIFVLILFTQKKSL